MGACECPGGLCLHLERARPGNENNRIANFLYIDEFPDFLGKSTEALFTMYRKYKVGTIITAQNLSQLDTPNVKEHYRQTILSNLSLIHI